MNLKNLSLFLLLGFVFIPLETASAEFADIPTGHVNADAVAYVQTEGIVNGYADGTYRPENKINRAEFTKIVVEAKFDAEEIDRCTESNSEAGWSYIFFPDVPKDAWFAKYVCVAKVQEVVNGYPDGTYRPEQNISFVEAAKIIVNAFGLSGGIDAEVWYRPFVQSLGEKSAIPTTIATFDHEITRGEMAEIVYRLLADVATKNSHTYEYLAEAGRGGENDQEKTCPETFDPSCGVIAVVCVTYPCPPLQTTYPNVCELEKAGAQLLHAGECTEEGTPETNITENSFQLEYAKVGDKIGGMVITKIESGTIEFSGEVTITGRYENHAPGTWILGEQVCIDDLDTISASKIPKEQDDTRRLWFCFDNLDLAKSKLGPEGAQGTVTVVIKNYTVRLTGGEVENTAELVEVLTKTPAAETRGETATVQEFDITAKQWEFAPNTITVKKGDTVRLNITSTDVDHGFALTAFDINEHLTPLQTVTVQFVANKSGEFSFFCSVFCGSGHGSMKGTFIVEE